MNTSIFYPSTSYKDYPLTPEREEKCAPYFEMNNVPPAGKAKYDEFMELINHSPDDVLIAWRGGQPEKQDFSRSAIELINQLTNEDYTKIAKSRKKIVGLSDVSFLLSSLVANGIPCYYGPNMYSGFMDSSEDQIKTMYDHLQKALNDSDYSIDFLSAALCTKGNEPWVFSYGEVTGRISGGNIDTITRMIDMGKETGIKEGDILFLEENDPWYNDVSAEEEFYIHNKIKKIISHTPKIKALIFGRSNNPMFFQEDMDEKVYVEKIVNSLNLPQVPIIANVACGHAHPSVTIPLGVEMCLDTYSQKLFRV